MTTVSSPAEPLSGAQELYEAASIPEATPAAPDLLCWLWAAVPPRRGRLHVSRAAAAFGVSDRTLRRWLANGVELDRARRVRATQLAILRSKGHLLWPDIDPGSRARGEARRRNAAQCQAIIEHEPHRMVPEWKTDGTLRPHSVLLIRYPPAHAYAVNVSRAPKTLQKIRAGGGQVMLEITAATKFAADLAKYAALDTVDEHRCVAPRTLVPIGRTDAWREAGGSTLPAVVLLRAHDSRLTQSRPT